MTKSTLIVTLLTLVQLVNCNFTHSEAQTALEASGITIDRPCVEKLKTNCTSLEGIYDDTINGLVDLKNKSGCSHMTVIGGTEEGNWNNGNFTQQNGDRVRIFQDECIDKYIKSNVNCESFSNDGSEFIACEDESLNGYVFVENQWRLFFFPRHRYPSLLSELTTMFSDWNITNVE